MDSDQTPRWNILGDDDDASKEETSLTRPAVLRPHIPESVLFQNIESEETDEDQDDEEDSSTQKKKKRFTTLLKSVFPSMVKQDRGLQSERAPTPHDIVPPQGDAPPESRPDLSVEDFDNAPLVVADAEDLPVEVVQNTEQIQHIENEPEHQQEIPRSNMPRETLVSAAVLPLDRQAIHHQEAGGYRGPSPTEKASTPATEPHKEPSFTEKFYKRRRERKLARKIKKQERLTKEIQRSQAAQSKAQERINQRHEREIEQLKNTTQHTQTSELPPAYVPATKIETILQDPKYYKQSGVSLDSTGNPMVYTPEKVVVTDPRTNRRETPQITKPERAYMVEPEKTPDHPKKPKFDSAFDAKYIKPLENRVSQLEKEAKNRIRSVPIVSGKLHRTPHRPKSTVYGMDAAPPPVQSQPRANKAKQQLHIDVAPMYKQSIQYGVASAVFIAVVGLLAYTLR